MVLSDGQIFQRKQITGWRIINNIPLEPHVIAKEELDLIETIEHYQKENQRLRKVLEE